MGWRSPVELTMCFVSATALASLIFVESRTPSPLIDLHLFRVFPFTNASITAICAFACFGTVAVSAFLFFMAPTSSRRPKSGLCILPMALCAAFSLQFLPDDHTLGRDTIFDLFWSFHRFECSHAFDFGNGKSLTLFVSSCAVFGMGFGMVNAPITYTAISGLPRDRAGVAAAFASSSRQIGVALGVALAGVIGGRGDSLGGHAGTEFKKSIDPLWWLIVISGFLIAGLGYIAASSWAAATARHAAHLFSNEVKNKT